ncbi:hypothetical protein vseg_003438 [Gypsophila vaccaria]
MEMFIVMEMEAGLEWIFHLDIDELLHPARTRKYSVRELLTELPLDVDMVVFPNCCYLFQALCFSLCSRASVIFYVDEILSGSNSSAR